jgi:hypothetical protein
MRHRSPDAPLFPCVSRPHLLRHELSIFNGLYRTHRTEGFLRVCVITPAQRGTPNLLPPSAPVTQSTLECDHFLRHEKVTL